MRALIYIYILEYVEGHQNRAPLQCMHEARLILVRLSSQDIIQELTQRTKFLLFLEEHAYVPNILGFGTSAALATCS